MESGGSMVRDASVRHGMEWRRDAQCLGSDPALFFPSGSKGLPLAQAMAAKQVCDACGVRQACLQYALDTHQDLGVWGGTTEEERRLLRRDLPG